MDAGRRRGLNAAPAARLPRLGKIGRDFTPSSEEPTAGTLPALPDWLQVLTTVVPMPSAEVGCLTTTQGLQIWHAHTRTPR